MSSSRDTESFLEPNALEEQVKGREQTFWESARERFRKNKVNMLALRFLGFLAVVALLADFLAYDKPLVCNRGCGIEFPILGDYLADFGLYKRDKKLINQDWRTLDYAWAIWPPVRYLPHNIDYANQRLLSPFAHQKLDDWKLRHYLGTVRDGRDVLSGLIHGTRIALIIGFIAMGIATFIGIILGAIAGFYGDNRMQLSTLGIALGILGLILGYFYGFQVRGYVLRDALAAGAGSFLWQLSLSVLIMIAVTVGFVQLARPFKRVPVLGKRRNVWVDVLISRAIEVQSAIPAFLLIITLGSLVEKKSLYFLVVIIGLLGWTGVARYMRTSMLRTRSMLYIDSARAIGMSELRILLRHAIPNSLTSVLVVITFGIAGAIVAEATLSFLGVGVPDNVVTWGGLLGEARSSLSAWWFTVFPGGAVFLTVTALNLVGEGLRDVLDPRLRHE
jgi:peptide/nickel transport system permease protein